VIVARPLVEARGNGLELSAEVSFERPTRETMRVWYRLPEPVTPPPKLGDPFLAGLLIPAMSLGEDLEIDAPVSAELLEAAREQLCPTLRRWGWEHVPIEIRCAAEASPLVRDLARGTGCFFSGGVDSWYTVLKRREELSHLILVWGFDIFVRDQRRWPPALELTRRSADDLGLPLLVVKTNLQDVSFFQMPWRLKKLGRPFRYYALTRSAGSMQVSIGLLLQSSLRHIVIPASWSDLDPEPKGSNRLLEPAWSSACQTYDLDGGEASRLDKTMSIFERRPEALRRLRVCFAAEGLEPNCGTCEKCMRTLVALRLCGAEKHSDSFGRKLDLEKVKDMRIRPYIRDFWLELLEAARSQGDTAAVKAIEIALGERFDWTRIGRRLGEKLGLRRVCAM
jgi:hypothetical protein